MCEELNGREVTQTAVDADEEREHRRGVELEERKNLEKQQVISQHDKDFIIPVYRFAENKRNGKPCREGGTWKQA